MSAILICAGEIYKDCFELIKKQIVCDKNLIIAVDGGIDYCNEMKIAPDYIIGDFDSAKNYPCIEGDKLIKLPVEKDDTDTLAAIKLGFEKGQDKFEIYGATGGRMDHLIANIQTLIYIKHNGGNGKLVDYGIDGKKTEYFIIENEEVIFDCNHKGIISLFSMGEIANKVSIKGLKYEANNIDIKNDFPIGVSNEFIDAESRISVEEGTLLCIVNSEAD